MIEPLKCCFAQGHATSMGECFEHISRQLNEIAALLEKRMPEAIHGLSVASFLEDELKSKEKRGGEGSGHVKEKADTDFTVTHSDEAFKCNLCSHPAHHILQLPRGNVVPDSLGFYCDRHWEQRKQLLAAMKAVSENEPVLTEKAKAQIERITGVRHD